MSEQQPWIVTGAGGFVGAHTMARLASEGIPAVGVDAYTDYYDPAYKRERVAALIPDAEVIEIDLATPGAFVELCQDRDPAGIIHLAAQPGVRTGLTNPRAYATDNLVGFIEVLEAARHCAVDHLLYASSSSVYGETSRMPFRASDPADHPASLYAATKRSNELMAHSYAHLFGVPTTGLRFFTVYGPWGRPDMAYSIFAKAILEGETITIHGDGSAVRDLTYVDDVVEAILRLLDKPPSVDPSWTPDADDASTAAAPWRVLNIGHGARITVMDLLRLHEACLGRDGVFEFGPRVPGDVTATHSDCAPLAELIGITPQVSVEAGVAAYCDWLTSHREGA